VLDECTGAPTPPPPPPPPPPAPPTKLVMLTDAAKTLGTVLDFTQALLAIGVVLDCLLYEWWWIACYRSGGGLLAIGVVLDCTPVVLA
jgi:hypothetical protein